MPIDRLFNDPENFDTSTAHVFPSKYYYSPGANGNIISYSSTGSGTSTCSITISHDNVDDLKRQLSRSNNANIELYHNINSMISLLSFVINIVSRKDIEILYDDIVNVDSKLRKDIIHAMNECELQQVEFSRLIDKYSKSELCGALYSMLYSGFCFRKENDMKLVESEKENSEYDSLVQDMLEELHEKDSSKYSDFAIRYKNIQRDKNEET